MGPPKRIIVACDGTWQDSDDGFVRNSYMPWDTSGYLGVPTNVTRICRAILPECPSTGSQQIVYYQAGLGSGNDWFDHFWGGTTGSKISENVREAYGFIAANYETGDEIFLIGFSRGAFTARTIAGLISAVGLLTRAGMEDFYPVFKDWENQLNDKYVTQWPHKPIHNKPKFLDPTYIPRLEQAGMTRANVPIKAVGVWDTVGSLGVPNFGIFPPSPPEFAFVNTEVSPNIEHAFHALALDEHRKPYSPTIWELPQGQKLPKVLKQCWFPGVHSNVGGSYDDQEIADITLAWMVSQLEPILAFDYNYVIEQRKLNVNYYQTQSPPEPIRGWGMGKLYNSLIGMNKIGGKKVRTPGQYCVTDPCSGKITPTPLKDTREHIHQCVRVRLEKKGKGMDDLDLYKPEALAGWKLLAPGEAYGKSTEYSDRYRWICEAEDGRTIVIPEMELGEVELTLKKESE